MVQAGKWMERKNGVLYVLVWGTKTKVEPG